MIDTVITLIFIQLALVIIIDLTGIVDEVKKRLWNYTYPGKTYKDFKFKPLGCSLCMTHHIGFLYLLISGHLTLPLYLILLLLAIFTTTTKNIIILVKDFIDGIIFRLQRLVERISQ